MRYRLIALCSAVLSAVALFCIAANAEEAKNDVKGLFLLTDYPAVTLRPGTTSSINLKLQNYGLPPERLALSVAGVPAGWTVTLIGNGQPVAAALPATNASVSLELRVDVPKDAPIGSTNLTVNAKGDLLFNDVADRTVQLIRQRLLVVASAAHAREQLGRERLRARQAADVGGENAALTLVDQGHGHFRGGVVGGKLVSALSRWSQPPLGGAS